MGRIVDVNGNPIALDELTEEIATPQITGVRSIWQQPVASGLTPEDLVRLLERSIDTDPRDFLQLCEDMEERDTHYFSVLGTRKLAVTGIPIHVEAASESADDVRIADETRAMLDLECVSEIRTDLLDALGKSFSVGEIGWDTSEKQWQPKAILHRDPRWFTFDRDTGRELRLRDDAFPIDGIPLKPYRFIVHRPRLKSGLPIRNGLARVVAFVNLAKMYALKDWLAFVEVFGQPIRVGKFGPSATKGDIAMLRRAVANIGTDAACVIPQSMVIEFTQAGNMAGAADVFQGLADWLDRQTSKAVLGQTMTSDAQPGGLGSNQASVHNEVRGDLRDADGDQLALTLQRDLVRPFVDLNFGVQKKYPKVVIRLPEPDDIEQLTKALQVFVPMGLEVEQHTVLDKLGLPEVKITAETKLLRAPAPAAVAAPGGDGEPAPGRAMNRRDTAAATLARFFPDPVHELTTNLDGRAKNAYEAMLQPVVQLLETAGSMQEALAGLDRLYPQMDDGQLAELIRDASAAAYLAGRSEVQDGR